MIIRNKFNGYSGDGRRLYPGGGGGQAPPSQQTVTQTTIPEYAKPYVERTLGLAEATAFTKDPRTGQITGVRQQPVYGGERIAPFSGLQQQYLAGASQLGPTEQIGEASGLASDVGYRAGQMGYGPQYFGNQYRAPMGYRPTQFAMQNVGTSTFARPGMAEAYMSPYQQAVTDVEKREAMRASDIMRSQQGAQAARAGAFGGSRQAIVEAERQRNLGQQLGDIQARGGQAAYDRAMQQFNAEQQARLQAQLANQQAFQQAQAGTEASRQFGYGQGMTAQQLAAQYGLAGQQAGEQSRQFAATYGLEGLKQQLAAAQQLGQLGQTQFAQEQQGLRELQQAGQMQQSMRQQMLDQQYQDFLRRQGEPYQQIAFMSDLLRGVPLSQQTQMQYTAPGSPIAQLGGLGLGAYGISQLMRGAKQGGLMSSGLSDLAVEQLSRG